MNNVLNQVRATLQLRLRTRSDQVLKAMNQALGCVYALHDMGCTVGSIEIRGDYAVLTIDKPPAGVLRGAIHVRRIDGRRRMTVYVAKVLGCQVQWIEADEPELLRRA